MPRTPRRASKRYLSSRTRPVSGSGGASKAVVESALKGVPSSGQTVTSVENCRPHCGHWSISLAAERVSVPCARILPQSGRKCPKRPLAANDRLPFRGGAFAPGRNEQKIDSPGENPPPQKKQEK